MIVLVDDDALVRTFLEDTLRAHGYEVEAYADAGAALARLGDRPPALIISDVMMPGMDGIEFRRTYAARFPQRRTPFLFLSSLGAESDQLRGLEAGADDYLLKSIPPSLLVARVRAALRRAGPPVAEASFQGDLAHCPFARIVEFCEAQGFTGVVEVLTDDLTTSVGFHGGQLDEAGPDGPAVLDQLFDLRAGAFLLRPRLPDFAALRDGTAPPPPLATPAPAEDRPAGRLSALSAGSRRLQLQTEFVTTPQPAVVSVAVLDGRTVLKRSTAAASADREARQRQVHAQHAEVEADIRERLESLLARKAEPDPGERPLAERRDALIERGLAAFLAGDHPAALATWEEAARLDPEHRSLQVNLGVVRRKLAKAG